nr:penicillin-binding protein 1A [Ideonella livida]
MTRLFIRSLLAVSGLALGGVLAAAIVGAFVFALTFPKLPELDALTDYQPRLPLRVFAADGTLLGEFGEERRTFVPVSAIPKDMINAVLAIEDARFYEHHGVDYIGLLRAALAQLESAGSQGASTITMQVARNFFLSTEKTLSRKLFEVMLSLKIEHELSKERILEIYMNQIYLGQRAYGFAAAAEVYFGKRLGELSVAECAMLAGLPKAPSAYNPIVNPKRAVVRQRYIIERMHDQGFITPEQRDTALAQTLKYRTTPDRHAQADYVTEMARQTVHASFGGEAYTRGLNVTLTIDAAEQQAAYKALRKGLLDYEARQAFRGPEAHVELPENANALDPRIAEALSDRPEGDELRPAVVLTVEPRRLTLALQNGESVTLAGDALKFAAAGLHPKADPKVQLRRGSIVRVMRNAKGEWRMIQMPEVEGALVSLDPQTGELKALVGGFDFSRNKFNHVTQAWRQPGSSFKPFIYSAAIEKGFNPSSVVDDSPLFFDAGSTGSQPWEPKNYDGTFDGPITLRRALAKSKNMVSIRLLMSVGVENARDWVTRFGFDRDKHDPYLTMALGSGSVTPLQVASAYGVFANGGYLVRPGLISRIADNRGKVLYQARFQAPDEAQRTLPARNAFVMNTLLQEVTRAGTAAKAPVQLKRTDLYGKTGTTNDAMDAWFAGFQPSRVAVVWIGFDTPKKLGDRETGGGLALPVWIDYMGVALRQQPVMEYTPPEGITSVNGEWLYVESAQEGGVNRLSLPASPASAPLPAEPAGPRTTEAERRSILELFR